MAFEEKKYLDLEGLKSYDAKLKEKIAADDKVLDDAIKLVSGNLTSEIANREAADTAINNKIGEVAEGKTVVQMIEEAQTAATYDDTEVRGLITAEADRAKAAEKANADAIDAIEADYLKAADKTELQGNIDTLAGKVGEVVEGKTVVGMIAENAEAIEAHKTAIDGKVTTLVGADEGKSVRTIANEELAAQLLSGEADADFKTLQELAAWLENHPESVAEINANIAALQRLIGTLPEDATATDIVGYIAEAVAAEKARAEEAEGGLADRIAELEEAVGEGGAVADQINNAIAELDANVDSTGSTLITVHVDEVDGKVTTVTVAEDLANTFDAKGAAEAAQAAAEATAAADATAKANAAQEAAAEDATTKANTAEQNAKDYADSLDEAFVKISSSEIDSLFA